MDAERLIHGSKIKLDFKGIVKIPKSIGDLTLLTGLHIRRGSLTDLPDSIGGLAQLTYLNLGNNSLAELPDSIGEFVQLTELYLYNNKLTDLPDSIGGARAINQTRPPPYNKLTNLPDSIGDLAQLTKLQLSHNPLTIILLTDMNISDFNKRISNICGNCGKKYYKLSSIIKFHNNCSTNA